MWESSANLLRLCHHKNSATDQREIGQRLPFIYPVIFNLMVNKIKYKYYMTRQNSNAMMDKN